MSRVLEVSFALLAEALGAPQRPEEPDRHPKWHPTSKKRKATAKRAKAKGSRR